MNAFRHGIFFALSLVVGGLSAEVWMRGAATVLEASGAVRIDIPSEDATYEDFTQPRYFSGQFSVSAASDASVLLLTSNELVFFFSGEGQFGIERFEDYTDTEVQTREMVAAAQSRMILSMRRGKLYMDTRRLTLDSRLVVETPLGRITSFKALMMIEIEYDYRSRIYEFTIACTDGAVRFTDRRGETYSILPGQRISGAGSYSAPAVEVGQLIEELREGFALFDQTLNRVSNESIRRDKLRSHSLILTEVDPVLTVVSPPLEPVDLSQENKPRVIGFAPWSECISPFRAEIKPPSSFKEDLF